MQHLTNVQHVTRIQPTTSILDQLGEFSMRFRDSLEGTVNVLDSYAYDDDDAMGQSCLGGRTGVAAITHVFDDVFSSSIDTIDALDGLSDAYIRRVIDNSNSLPPSLFVPEKAFISLVKEQIARLEQPGIQVSSSYICFLFGPNVNCVCALCRYVKKLCA